MHIKFWDIDALKNGLRTGDVGERDSLYYLVALGSLMIALSAVSMDRNLWDWVDLTVSLVAFSVGTAFVYRENGGDAGDAFVLRYVSLVWVFGIRFTILLVGPVLIFVLCLEFVVVGEVPERSTPLESAAMALLDVLFYLGLGRHMRSIATRSA